MFLQKLLKLRYLDKNDFNKQIDYVVHIFRFLSLDFKFSLDKPNYCFNFRLILVYTIKRNSKLLLVYLF